MGFFGRRESDDAREDRADRDRVRRRLGPEKARETFRRNGTHVPKGEDRDSEGYPRTGHEDWD
jgi:hypothetical protein